MKSRQFQYEVTVEETFSAAHQLRGYRGKCENIHGHNWKIQVSVSSNSLTELGFVIDFSELRGMLKEILAGLDHCFLNEITPFSIENPTAENIAVYVFEALKTRLSSAELWVNRVSVHESDRAFVTLYGNTSGDSSANSRNKE